MHDLALTEPGLIVYRFDAPLVFANVAFFTERMAALIANAGPGLKCVILDAEAISDFPEMSVASWLARRRSKKQKGNVAVARIRERCGPLLIFWDYTRSWPGAPAFGFKRSRQFVAWRREWLGQARLSGSLPPSISHWTRPPAVSFPLDYGWDRRGFTRIRRNRKRPNRCGRAFAQRERIALTRRVSAGPTWSKRWQNHANR